MITNRRIVVPSFSYILEPQNFFPFWEAFRTHMGSLPRRNWPDDISSVLLTSRNKFLECNIAISYSYDIDEALGLICKKCKGVECFHESNDCRWIGTFSRVDGNGKPRHYPPKPASENRIRLIYLYLMVLERIAVYKFA